MIVATAGSASRPLDPTVRAAGYGPVRFRLADALVLGGSLAELHRLPEAADAYCVIEVADSSYEVDTGLKLHGYARVGVPQYTVINLRNRTAEVYTDPDSSAGTYPPPAVVTDKGVLSLRVGEAEMFPVPLSDLLP